MTVILGADRDPTATGDDGAGQQRDTQHLAAAGAAAAVAIDSGQQHAPQRLAGRVPVVSPERLVAELAPPPRFAAARFDTYVPDPAEPSQAAARDLLAAWGARPGGAQRTSRFSARRLLGRAVPGYSVPVKSGRAASATGGDGRSGVYLDGGYGVGKTHLLASLWHATEGQKAYGTFVEYTNLVGALGFAACVARLATRELVCIDEFELDDPGDTVLISTLLSRLAEAGVRLAATSNTLPDRLGEGRFAAADFLREIQGLAARFTTVRIEGRDYRRRETAAPPRPAGDRELAAFLDSGAPGRVCDDFDELIDHLATLHPSRYGALLDGVGSVALRGLRPVEDQNAALRLVVLVDRLYDRSIPVLACGVPVDRLFTPELLAGGYRKKYLRATSRLVSLAAAGSALVPSRP